MIRFKWALASVVIITALFGCKAAKTHSDSDVKYLAASADGATNQAIFLGMPAGDAWISNNLWPVRDAVAQDPGFNGAVAAHDNVGKAAALQYIRDAASKVSADGTLFIMMAGHGSPDGLIQTHDRAFMNSSDLGNAIAQGRQNKGRFKRLVLLVFSCYSGNWVNGRAPLAQSEAFISSDSLDKQLFEMSSNTADRATLELAAGLSKSRGIYEQVLVASSQVYNQLSWGDHFGQTFGRAYTSLQSNSRDTARIVDLMQHIAKNTPMNQPQYRAFPEHEVLNDYLFKASPFSATVTQSVIDENGEKKMRISIPTKLGIGKLRFCTGDAVSCLTAKSDVYLKKLDEVEADNDQFELEDSSTLEENTHVTIFGFRGDSSPAVVVLDADKDGVPDNDDLCAGTPNGKTVWKSGPYTGCAEGQKPRQIATQNQPGQKKSGPTVEVMKTYFFDGNELLPDGDGDGVDDRVDFCYPTPSKAQVIKSGSFAGCTADEKKKRDAMIAIFDPSKQSSSGGVGGDADGDGVSDQHDRCGRTPAARRASIIQSGYWMGCAPGENATR